MMMALGLGPSPLARGKLSLASVTVPVMGTIPARAGETVQDAAYHTVHGDHPRSRGGNIAGCNFWATHLGPSPLARGKHRHGLVREKHHGTIPARAGETGRDRCQLRRAGDHPRSRGGNHPTGAPNWPTKGPSPLARGKRSRSQRPAFGVGTIPARAGETEYWRLFLAFERDHPRSRGGNTGNLRIHSFPYGPSPLARGKRRQGAGTGVSRRTIPARAGETAPNDYIELGTRDHPRSRGGNMPWPKTHYLFQGPSPLARGKRWLMRLAWMTSGTIPARAGETVSHEAIDPHLGDHPRSRGGNCQRLTVDDRYQGPSPLARGKRIRNQ